MRVIAGEFRGRKLLPPENEATRPITDRVKQSLFDILAPRIETALILDLFAGTGSLGLESLSRGAAQAVFFETERSAVARLRRNIEALGLGTGRAVVQPTDVFEWFRERVRPIFPSPGTPGEGQGEGVHESRQNAPHPNPLLFEPEPQSRRPEYREREKSAPPPQADIIFLDPPYRYLTDQTEDLRHLGRLFAQRHLKPDGIVVFRHDAHDVLELPGLLRYDQRTYGGMMLEFLAIANAITD